MLFDSKHTACLFALLISLLIAAPAAAQQAETPAALPIGVVDMIKVRQSSDALRSISEQISAYRNTFQKDIQDEETSLREANQELARQRSILSAEAFNAERKNFEARVAEVQRGVQQRKAELERVRETAMLELHRNLNSVIAEIAEERGLVIVLPRAQTILSAKNLEITDEVTTRLNVKLPDVTVPQPGQ